MGEGGRQGVKFEGGGGRQGVEWEEWVGGRHVSLKVRGPV